MKRIYSAIIMLLFCASQTFSQDLSKFGDGTAENPYVQKGQFSMGIRQTTSLFGHDKIPGLGVGGQMRWQIFDYLSTEWFTDWITIDLDGAGTRNNAHIGWSVMFYPTRKGRVIPYAIAGHCFDFAKVIPLSNEYLDRSGDVITRWSSAIQAGLGSHFYLTDRFEISLSAQYMLHLGDHLDYELTNTPNGSYLETQEHTTGQAATEGHLLISASINFKMADLW